MEPFRLPRIATPGGLLEFVTFLTRVVLYLLACTTWKSIPRFYCAFVLNNQLCLLHSNNSVAMSRQLSASLFTFGKIIDLQGLSAAEWRFTFIKRRFAFHTFVMTLKCEGINQSNALIGDERASDIPTYGKGRHLRVCTCRCTPA